MQDEREIKFKVYFKNVCIGYERLTPNGWECCLLYLEKEGEENWIVERLTPNGWECCLLYLEKEGEENWILGTFSIKPCQRGQFTGRKDRNGKEIYEGDIVKDIIVGLKSEVVFTNRASFGLRPLKNEVRELEDEIIYSTWSESAIEVIGNIFENPELLNKQPS